MDKSSASAGFAMGGPIGGAIGAAVVGGLNLIDNKKDKETMIERGIAENREKFYNTKAERARAYGDQKAASDAEKRLTGFSSNYKTSQWT